MAHKITGNHNHGRAAIADFLCPDNGFRGKQIRKGIQPKDHMKENRLTLKSSQIRAREQREEDARVPKELYKLQQFRDVSARVFEPSSRYDQENYENHNNNNNDNNDNYDENGDAIYLTKGVAMKRMNEIAKEKHAMRAELDAKMEEARYYADRPVTPRKAAVPRAIEKASLAPRSNADFISRNKAKAQCMIPPTETNRDGGSGVAKHEEYGRVPNYLEERKAKWASEQEEIRRRAPDPNCPPGMTLMPEAERASTLDVLRSSREEAMKMLGKMPFVIETPSLRRKQSELEAKLREIESAITLFSKPKVYIAIDR